MDIKLNSMKGFICIVLMIACCGCNQQAVKVASDKFDKNQYLKQYALCQCIYEGLKSDSLANHDNSTWGAVDLCDCDPRIFVKIDSLSKVTAHKILPIQASGDKNKKPIIAACFNFYNSDTLDSLIKKNTLVIKH